MSLAQPRRRRIGRWIILVLLVVAVAVAAFGILRRRNSGAEQRTLVERLEQGLFVREVSGTGTVEASRERNLSFKSSGIVAEILVTEGQAVEAGTLLAKLETASLQRELASNQTSLQSARADLQRILAQQQIDQLDLRSSIASAEDSLANAQQSLSDAQDELAVTEQLFASGAASRNELQAAQDAFATMQRRANQAEIALQSTRTREASFNQLAAAQQASAEANIASLETSIANLQERLDEAELLAPFAGVVAAINFDLGDTVSPADTVRLVDTSRLTVKARFDENRALELSPAQSARIIPDADTTRELEAVVTRVNPVALREGSAAQLGADIDFGESAQQDIAQGLIKPGYTVTARVTVNSLDDVLLIPLEAITETNEGSWVYRVSELEPGGGTAERTDINILDRNATVAAAESSELSAGDLIALINIDEIADGEAVEYTPIDETEETP